jgi:hypothetical protein
VNGVFWENASRLLDAAVIASAAGHATENMTVLIGQEGGIHLIANNDWPLDRIAEERGARTAYRVQHAGGRVAVEGREGDSICRLETESPGARAKRLLQDRPRYLLT